MEADILQIITQLQNIVDTAKGLPEQKGPKGVNVAPHGSTFDKNSIPPSLSAAERSRVKEVAEIFREELFPKSEARRLQIRERKKDRKAQIEKNLQFATSKDKGGSGVLGGIAGFLGGLGGILGGGGAAAGLIGAAPAIMAASLPILAGLLGLSVVALAGGKAFQMVMEGLKMAKDVDWDKVREFTGVITGVLGDVMNIVKDFIGFMLDQGIKFQKHLFVMWKEAFGMFMGAIKEFITIARTFDWDYIVKILEKGVRAVIGVVEDIIEFGSGLLGKGADKMFEIWQKGVITMSVVIGILGDSLQKYKGLEWGDLGKAAVGIAGMVAAFTAMGTIGAVTGPMVALGSLIAQMGAVGIGALGTGLQLFGDGMKTTAEGILLISDVDAEHLKAVAFAVGTLGDNLVGFAKGVGAANIVSILSSMFGATGPVDSLIKFADKHAQLGAAATSVYNLAGGFKEWADVRINDLAYNLEMFNKQVDAMDLKKIDQARTSLGTLRTHQSYVTEKIHGYLVSGNGDNGNGVVGVTKELIAETRKQHETIKQIRDTVWILERNRQNGEQRDAAQRILNPQGTRPYQTGGPRAGMNKLFPSVR